MNRFNAGAARDRDKIRRIKVAGVLGIALEGEAQESHLSRLSAQRLRGHACGSLLAAFTKRCPGSHAALMERVERREGAGISRVGFRGMEVAAAARSPRRNAPDKGETSLNDHSIA